MTLLTELTELSEQRKNVNSALKTKIIQAVHESIPITQVAKASGVSRVTITAWVKNHIDDTKQTTR